jgi:ABC-type multidrug transport system ATPase subunit
MGGTLAWRDVEYVVRTKDADGHNASSRVILRGTSAHANSGRVLAILGPSGCGKTSLLNALSHRLDVKRGDSLECVVTYDGKRITGADDEDVSMSYVEQEPKFFSNLTVRETLELDARLRGETQESAAALVNSTLRKMSLMTCADTVVGGDTGGKAVAGISGGERRRLAIASETLGLGTTDSKSGGGLVVLVDEPTSGLDAFQADKMVEKLVELAEREDACVVCTLHQPRSASFAKVHDVLLLASGARVAYHGPSEDVISYFRGIGFECPEHFNPAEFLIDLVSVDVGDGVGSDDAEAKSRARIERIVDEWAKHSKTTAPRAADVTREPESASTSKAVRKKACDPLKQFRLLAGRAWRQAKREMWVNGVRMVASVGLAAMFGGCNFQLGLGPRSVKRRVAVLMQACINTSMLALVKSLNGFPRERATVRREMARQSGGYSPGPYFLSKLLIETPIDMVFPVVFGGVMAPMVGLNKSGRKMFLTSLALQSAAASSLGLSISALSPSADVALAIGPCVMVLNIMLGDASGAFAEIPDSLAPLSKLSLIRHAFEGVLCSEFEGLVFEKEDTDAKSKKLAKSRGVRKVLARRFNEGVPPRNGEDVLEGLGLPVRGHAGRACKSQLGVAALNVAVTYVALVLKRAK